MSYRVLPLFLAALALAWFAGGPLLAAENEAAHKGHAHEGTVVSAGGHSLVMTDKDGKNEHKHEVAADAKVTLDGKPAKLEDFKAGMHVRVTMSGQAASQGAPAKAVRVEAASTKEKQ